jgi:NAD(P)H-dependent FMN reductase
LAVIGVSNGRYGGVWAHDNARKAASIAGASVLDDVTLSVPHGATRFATIHPAHDDEIAHAMPTILAALAAAFANRRQLVPES